MHIWILGCERVHLCKELEAHPGNVRLYPAGTAIQKFRISVLSLILYFYSALLINIGRNKVRQDGY